MTSADHNLVSHVLCGGAETPDKIALAVLGPARAERWSYARIEAAVRGIAHGLRARGIAPGDRVLMRLGNEAAFPLAFLGAAAAGAVAIATSARLTAPEITAIARRLGPSLVLAAPGVALPDHPAPVVPVEALKDWAEGPAADIAPVTPDTPAYIVMTSGTGGTPRAVIHAHRAVPARAVMRDGWTDLRPDDRLMHAGAMNWTYTLGTGLLDPWSVGATALVPAEGTDPALLPLLAKRHDATILAAVPGVFRKLLKGPLPPLPRLRHALSAGEKLPETLRAAWREATGTEIHEAFGQSECSTFLSGSPARPAPPGTLGFPQPGRRIALIAGGAEAEEGEIAIHADDPGLALGYDDGPLRRAGDWVLTGDAGRRTPEGAIAYLGRTDDLITAGGYRISPLEIEAAFCALPGVEEAAAVTLRPAPDTTIIGAFVTGPAPLDLARLKAQAGEVLADWKLPHHIEQVDRLPRGANDKLLRQRIAQDWNARHGHA